MYVKNYFQAAFSPAMATGYVPAIKAFHWWSGLERG
jgi:hypothetical protein